MTASVLDGVTGGMLPAVLAAAATAVAVRGPAAARIGVLRSEREPTGRLAVAMTGWRSSPWTAAVLAAVLVLGFVGGWAGVVGAVVLGGIVRVWAGRLERAADRRRRERRRRDLPLAADLLVAALAAGRAPVTALRSVGHAVGGPLGDDLLRACARVDLGADPESVWATLGRDDVLGGVGRAFARSERSGASVVESLTHVADDLRRRRRTEAGRAARSVGVRTAAPLGLCFLPAFVLVAVVPAVAAVLEPVLGGVLP